MKIKQLRVTNFRLLDNVILNLEDDITLIVGKNNTGKTSLFEAINIFAKSQEISFEDFSQSTYLRFNRLLSLYLKTKDSEEVIKEKAEKIIQEYLPKIQAYFLIDYDPKIDSLINLSEFITDLDENRNDATILISYESNNSLGIFSSFIDRDKKETSLISWLKDNSKKFYHFKCFAFDKDSNFKKDIDLSFKSKVEKIVSFEDIKASRTLDDTKSDKNKTLATGFAHYYRERDKNKDDVKKLENTLLNVSKELKGEYEEVLKDVLDDLNQFGASTPITIPRIEIDSEFNSESVIKNNIKYYYKHDVINLPESYNGLGYSNLIFMVLELTSFIERFKNSSEEKKSEFLTILIEEPEAHMHPQMQQVFIKQIAKKIDKAKEEGIYIQLIITTHSSHIIAEAGIDLNRGFDRIRYFNKISGKLEISDFNNFRHKESDKETFRFLKQYLNLHKCDIFFADKVIMVEGVTEKMLLPIMINKVANTLNNEYISILEVGGAYTQKFKELLHFIKVKTLVITDIDSVDENKEECKTDVLNAETCNSTLKDWIPKKRTIEELINCTEEEMYDANFIRVAFQISELNDNYVARSLEEAIINRNLQFFRSEYVNDGTSKKIKSLFTLIDQHTSENLLLKNPWELRPKSSSSKTNFSFDLMTFDENETGINWNVPRYIKEGLEWLAGMCIVNIERN